MLESPATDLDLARAAQMAAPPAKAKTHREFTASLVLPDGPQAGERMEPDAEPFQSVMLDGLDGKLLDATGRPFRDFVLAAAAQVGKSLIAVLVPSMSAVCEGESVVYCLPTGDLISKVWTTKLLPTIRGCGLGAWLPEAGPGSRGGKPTALVMRNPANGRSAGAIIFVAGGEGKKREVGQAGVTARKVLIDEADEYEDMHRIALIRQRAASFGREAITLATSTVKKDSKSVILALYGESTASRLWFACPHCQRFQPLDWESVRYEGADDILASESARYYCAHCAAAWTETERRIALRRFKVVHKGQSVDESGNVVGAIPRVSTFGLLVTKLCVGLGLTLGDLAVEHRRAKALLEENGDHGLMRSFYRDRLAQEYTAEMEEMESATELTWRYLFHRSIKCEWGPVLPITDREAERAPTYSRHVAVPPQDCLGCCAGVDVQHDRVYWVLTAYAADGSTYDTAWGYEYAREDRTPANPAELYALLDRTDLILHEYAAHLPLTSVGLDVGDQTDALKAWLKGKPTWKATKGTASPGLKDEPGDIPGIVHRRDGLYLIAIDAVRELIHSAYRRPNGEPGACHIPSGLQNTATDSAYLRHLVAERMVLDDKTKKFKLIRGPGRWDWQDARRIAEVMIRLEQRPKRLAPTRRYGAVGRVG